MGERRRWALATGLLVLTGCTTDAGRDNRRGDDPLLGASPRSGSQPLAIATANGVTGPATPAYQPKPPLTAATPTSNAALAGGGFQPLAGSNDLRIGSGSPTVGTPASGVQLQQPAFNDPRAPAPPAGFSPVTPVPPPGAPVNNPQPPSTAMAPGGSLDQAYTAVAARNPLWTRMTYNGDTREYLFQVKVPSRLNTAVPQTVEASAANPADAIKRALEQLGQ